MKARKRDGTGRAATRIFMRFVAPAATAMVEGILVAMVAAGCGGATSTASLKGSPFRSIPVFADCAKAVGDSVAAVSLGHPADSSATATRSTSGPAHTPDPHAGQHHETCSTCGGAGTVMHNVWVTPMRTCSFCFGTGLYNHLTPDTPCPICHGAGQVPDGPPVLTPQAETCTTCGGAGFVWVANP